MPWRHRDSDISDSFPHDGYRLEDVEKLSANVIDLLEIPRDFLYLLGLTSHWDHPGFQALLVDAEGKGITLSSFLFIVSVENPCLYVDINENILLVCFCSFGNV